MKITAVEQRVLALILLVSSFVIALDQMTKHWIRTSWDGDIEILGQGWLVITFTTNDGAAFGINLGEYFPYSLVGFVVIATLIWWLRREWAGLLLKRTAVFAVGAMIGGIVGNLIDRWRDGAVTDFIAISQFPVFNLADSFLVIGSLLLAYVIAYPDLFRDNGETKALE